MMLLLSVVIVQVAVIDAMTTNIDDMYSWYTEYTEHPDRVTILPFVKY